MLTRFRSYKQESLLICQNLWVFCKFKAQARRDLGSKGLDKVRIEWGLHCIAHNMRKIAAVLG